MKTFKEKNSKKSKLKQIFKEINDSLKNVGLQFTNENNFI